MSRRDLEREKQRKRLQSELNEGEFACLIAICGYLQEHVGEIALVEAHRLCRIFYNVPSEQRTPATEIRMLRLVRQVMTMFRRAEFEKREQYATSQRAEIQALLESLQADIGVRLAWVKGGRDVCL